MIPSPCFPEITSFYSNYFAKQLVKVVYSGWSTIGLNVFFFKSTQICVCQLHHLKPSQLHRRSLPILPQNEEFQPKKYPNPVHSVHYMDSDKLSTIYLLNPAGPAPPRSFQWPSGSFASVVLISLTTLSSAACSHHLSHTWTPFPLPAQERHN